MPMLFCNIGWMARYKGQERQPDKIVGGGKYVVEHGTGGEVCNFRQCDDGYVYGHVETLKGDEATGIDRDIKIEQLGARTASPYIDGVDVIWTATHPTEGQRRVVGWYRNARVYRKRQEFADWPSEQHRLDNVETFRIRARAEDAILLDLDERKIRLGRGPGWMGHAQWWYAERNPSPEVRDLLALVARQISTGVQAGTARPRWGGPPDTDRKLRVEQAAIEAVISHYHAPPEAIVKSVERDNLGWDLEVWRNNLLYRRLEVKGLSGADIQIGLTPNEYRALKEHIEGRNDQFRLCIVSEALAGSPKLQILYREPSQGRWKNEFDECYVDLNLTEIMAAIVRVLPGRSSE